MVSMRWLVWCLVPLACGDDVASGGGSSSSAGTTDTSSSSGLTDASTTSGTTEEPTSAGSTTGDESSTSHGSSSDGPGSEDGSSSGTLVCGEDEFGPLCTPCSCVNGTCDDGADGTGACTCDEGFAGESCDEFDCGPDGTFEEGGCATPLTAIADVQVVSGEFAMDNFGTGQFTPFGVGLQNDFTGGQIGRALVKFDLSALPPGLAIDSARIVFKEFDNYTGFPTTVALVQAESDWDESTVTWDTQPAFVDVALATADVGCCGEVHEFDVSTVVLGALDDGVAEVSFELQADDETVIEGVRWFMREGAGVNINGIIGAPPQLVVRWDP